MSSPSTKIESIRIRGFRSLADVDLAELNQATVLIGPNGSGKSNIMRFVDMLHHMLRHQRLGQFVERQGGASDQLFGGSGVTERIEAEIALKAEGGGYDYRISLEYAHPDRLSFSQESLRCRGNGATVVADWQDLGNGHREANLLLAAQSEEFPHVPRTAAQKVVNALRQCVVYHFHNTDDRSYIKQNCDVSDCNRLRNRGDNLAAVLYRMEREDRKRYARICRYIRRILPGFDHFEIEEHYGKVALRWRADWSDHTFGAHLTSDGSLRAFALVTLLNLPTEMLPDVILLDEPELGLHPAAVTLLGSMIRALSERKQVIVATQSPLLVNSFDLAEVIVLELNQGRTEVRRYDPDEYRHWLEDYAAGELWEKNLLGGLP